MKLKYTEYNSKADKTLVLIHGYRDTSKVFDDFVNQITEYRVISIDLPQTFSNDTFSIEELADYTEEIINECEVNEFSLLGFSLGGVIAKEIASRNKNVYKLLLINSAPSLIIRPITRKLFSIILPILYSKIFLIPFTFISRSVVKPISKTSIQPTIEIYRTVLKCTKYDGLEKFKQLPIDKKIFISDKDKVFRYKYLSHLSLPFQEIKNSTHDWETIPKSELKTKILESLES